MNGNFQIRMIPIEKIRILNPRERNKRKFSEIVGSIQSLGLKRPITVSSRGKAKDGSYDLVCGQGRMEAYIRLGQTEVPAIVVSVNREDCMLMSLVENLARRQPSSMEHVRQIAALKERGYNNSQIARKVNMHVTHIGGIIRLLQNGEERLIREVDQGKIPLTVAIAIANTSDEHIQKVLSDAYDKKQLKGKELLRARKIYEQRRTLGKSLHGLAPKGASVASSDAIIRAYNQEAQKQRLLLKRAKLCETQLLIIINSLRQLLNDKEFRKILTNEGLESIPKNLADRIRR